MEELKKKLKSHARRTYIPMIIAAAICSLLGLSILGGALITRMNEFKELNDYTEYQLQTGDYYKLSDFNIILDWFAEDDDGKYYLILRESDSKWMGLYLKSSADKKTAEKIIEDNDRYLNDETDSLSDSSISVKGRLRNMDSDEKQYFQEYLEASGYSSTELYEVADFRTLDTSDTNSGMLIAGILISAACLIWLFMSLRNLLGDGYVKKVQAKISERGMNPDHVAASLANCKSFKNIDLTSMFAVLYGMDAELIPYDELVWVYAQVHTTVHKLYGIIPTRVTTTMRRHVSIPMSDCSHAGKRSVRTQPPSLICSADIPRKLLTLRRRILHRSYSMLISSAADRFESHKFNYIRFTSYCF